jgi:hypothetical protein
MDYLTRFSAIAQAVTDLCVFFDVWNFQKVAKRNAFRTLIDRLQAPCRA